MQFWIVYKAENIEMQKWMIYYCSCQEKYHIAKLEDLLKVLRKTGLKISPKKCQLL